VEENSKRLKMRQVSFEDFMSYPKRIFKLIFWNPFVDFKTESGIKSAIRYVYLLSMNFAMILGAVLELVYCFTLEREAEMIVNITKSLPIAGKLINMLIIMLGVSTNVGIISTGKK
jgi:hypothetical protein